MVSIQGINEQMGIMRFSRLPKLLSLCSLRSLRLIQRLFPDLEKRFAGWISFSVFFRFDSVVMLSNLCG